MRPESPKPPRRYRYGVDTVMELFDIGPWVALLVLAMVGAVFMAGAYYIVKSAPPSQVTMSSGPEDSSFHRTALRYQKALAESGVKLNILPSEGSLENLLRVIDADQKVDLALVATGVAEDVAGLEHVNSLGAISKQPIYLFYRGAPIERLVEMKGKKIVVGKGGSGARKLALKLLELNGIKEDTTPIYNRDAQEIAGSLLSGEIDAAFIMSENMAIAELRKLMLAPGIRLFSFRNANAYARKIDYLNVMDLPQGLIDFGANVPAQDVELVGPMIELIANENLHPAISDLVLDAATSIHARPGMFQKRGEFPLAIEQNIKLSDDATRFYKSGKTFFYRHLPFWLASSINRILIVFVPMLVLLIPAVRSVPALFRWRNQIRIRRLYRELLQVEQKSRRENDQRRLEVLRAEFERIDQALGRMRVRPAYADQFYHLRVHVDYVRRLLSGTSTEMRPLPNENL